MDFYGNAKCAVYVMCNRNLLLHTALKEMLRDVRPQIIIILLRRNSSAVKFPLTTCRTVRGLDRLLFCTGASCDEGPRYKGPLTALEIGQCMIHVKTKDSLGCIQRWRWNRCTSG